MYAAKLIARPRLCAFRYAKDPAVLKILRDSKFTIRSVFTMPPDALCCEPFFGRRDACKAKENDVRASGVAVVNHCAVANLLCIVNLL